MTERVVNRREFLQLSAAGIAALKLLPGKFGKINLADKTEPKSERLTINPDELQVMTIGDSITANGIMPELVKSQLEGIGYGVKMIGDLESRKDKLGTAAKGGINTGQFLRKIQEDEGLRAITAKANLVTISLGTNDVSTGRTITESTNNIAAIIGEVLQLNPDAKILVMPVPPDRNSVHFRIGVKGSTFTPSMVDLKTWSMFGKHESYPDEVAKYSYDEYFNASLEQVVAAIDGKNPRMVYFAGKISSNRTPLDEAKLALDVTDYRDSLHPNEAGEMILSVLYRQGFEAMLAAKILPLPRAEARHFSSLVLEKAQAAISSRIQKLLPEIEGSTVRKSEGKAEKVSSDDKLVSLVVKFLRRHLSLRSSPEWRKYRGRILAHLDYRPPEDLVDMVTQTIKSGLGDLTAEGIVSDEGEDLVKTWTDIFTSKPHFFYSGQARTLPNVGPKVLELASDLLASLEGRFNEGIKKQHNLKDNKLKFGPALVYGLGVTEEWDKDQDVPGSALPAGMRHFGFYLRESLSRKDNDLVEGILEPIKPKDSFVDPETPARIRKLAACNGFVWLDSGEFIALDAIVPLAKELATGVYLGKFGGERTTLSSVNDLKTLKTVVTLAQRYGLVLLDNYARNLFD